MRFSSATTGVIALLAAPGLTHPGQLAERAACTTNSCLAALASRTATAKADCSTFVVTTVTPCAKTVKSTVTVTSTPGCPAPVITSSAIIQSSVACPVTQSPTAVPTYASGACANGAAFSSACGCLNVRASHTTLPASTVTVTAYKTIKVQPTFTAKIVRGPDQEPMWATGYDYDPDQPTTGSAITLIDDASLAEWFTIDGNGTVYGANGTLPWASYAEGCYSCYNNIYEYPPSNGFGHVLTCRLGTELQGDGYFPFFCKAPLGGFRFQECSLNTGYLELGGTPNEDPPQCELITMGAYPVCK